MKDLKLVVILVGLCFEGALSLQCYECNDVTSLGNCVSLATCTNDDVCIYREYVNKTGEVSFSAGCAPRYACSVYGLDMYNHRGSQETCCRTCETKGCNWDTCNTAYRCYNFTGVTSLHGGLHQQCGIYEECYLEVYENQGELRYYAGCAPLSQCAVEYHLNHQNVNYSLPHHYGHKRCAQCCGGHFCNKKLCQEFLPMTTGAAAMQTSPSLPESTSPPLPQCYQCYDLRIDDRGNVESCFNLVSCLSYTSKCSSVYRREGIISTVDMDCEENLPCNQTDAPTQLCRSCCVGDTCNRDLDCRPVLQSSAVLQTTSTSQSLTTSATTPSSTQATTPSTTSIPTQQTSPRSSKGVQCAVCTGPLCGVSPDQESFAVCPDYLAPFCLNKITNDANGNKKIIKRCGGAHECEEKWLKESSNKTECVNFDHAQKYTFDFECTLCCTTPNCNTKLRPDINTLF